MFLSRGPIHFGKLQTPAPSLPLRQVDLQSSVPAALVPLKPKIYLTCQLHMEPGYWYRVM